MNKIKYSFAPGFDRLRTGDAKLVKMQILGLLDLKYPEYYYKKKRGIVNIPHQLYEAITGIFEKFGVSENDVWEKTNV